MKAYYAALIKRQQEQDEAARKNQKEPAMNNITNAVEQPSERKVGAKSKREEDMDGVEWEEATPAGNIYFLYFTYSNFMCSIWRDLCIHIDKVTFFLHILASNSAEVFVLVHFAIIAIIIRVKQKLSLWMIIDVDHHGFCAFSLYYDLLLHLFPLLLEGRNFNPAILSINLSQMFFGMVQYIFLHFVFVSSV